MDSVEFAVRKANWSDDVEIVVFTNNRSAFARTIMFKKLEDGEIINPLMRLEKKQAQTLMDQLWDCGLRPSEGTGSAGSLAATQRHLEDMRTLVFNKNKSTDHET